LQSTRSKEEQQTEQQIYHVQCWQPPDEEYIKCNIDAALLSDQGCFGVGMCLRNSRGYFIKALTKWYESVPPRSPPLGAEALGLRDAISWLGQLGLSKVHIELDCKLVVDSIIDNHSEFGNIMATCKVMLQ
jgi:ribonuclease HI